MQEKPTIRLLITDLDNTLYDWVTYFTSAFYEMVAVACVTLEVPESVLLDELRDIHRVHHNSEHPFALLETPTVLRRFESLSRLEKLRALAPAFDRFKEVRLQTLRGYPSVVETLAAVRKAGCRIFAHTEASSVNAAYRLKVLNLVSYFETIYAPASSSVHPDPERAASLDDILSKMRYVEERERKPNPDLLAHICRDAGVELAQALYVGDSRTRDIGMAVTAGVRSAWARYGTTYEKHRWQQLVRITHWSDEDVERERLARERYASVEADVNLDSFAELLQHFEFSS